jgi:Short C-terminal domain
MFVRRRPLLRAAAIGGSAYMIGKNRAQHQAEAQAPGGSQPGQQSGGSAPAQGQAPAPGHSQGGGGSAMSDQLNRLASLHQQGALTDTEFAAAKAKVLRT